MAVMDVNYYIVAAGDETTAYERFVEMEVDSKSFYIVGEDLYIGRRRLSNQSDITNAINALSLEGGAIYTINQTLTKLEGNESVSGSIRAIIKS